MIKFNHITFLTFLLALFTTIPSNAQHSNQNLWYTKPASHWNEALPIGNGRIGGMVFGTTSKDKIQLNEETVWAGEPGNNVDTKDAYSKIQEIRQLLFDGKYEEAQNLSDEVFPRKTPSDTNHGMQYQPVGDLILDFGHENVSNYKRTLDLENAISSTSYLFNGVNYNREYFISHPQQVMIVHLTADKKGKINFKIGMESIQKINKVSVEHNILFLEGTSGDEANKKGKVRFDVAVLPIIKSGKIISNANSLEIQNADEATLIISIGTNFKNYKDLTNDARKTAMEYLNKAKSQSFKEIRKAHITDYQNLYKRVALNLGKTSSEILKQPTDVRLSNFSKQNDLDLVALYFQYGRYLLISSSREGGQPANLQGIWNDKLSPPWDSKYTVNINTEMNYWPAEVTNLSELHQPLFDMIEDLSVTGKESAQKMYQAKGWNMHHNTDLWRVTGIIDGGFYGMWPMGGAWLTQHIWMRYLYTGDINFLKKYYPILKSTAEFYADVLQKEPENGWLVVTPSMSPENKYYKEAAITYGATMDNQLVFDVFSNVIKASEILNLDTDFRKEIQQKRDLLPPMQIGKISQLQEWIKDWDRADDKHRHISHLYGLHPSAQISPFKNPELFEAAENTLTYRGDKSTGWSMGWKVNFWARLLNGNRSYDLIKEQLTLVDDYEAKLGGGTYLNLLDAHPPFQIDGNFGCTAGIAEMLMQSHDEAVYILPALPDEWNLGEIKGLKAIGGFEINLKWTQNKVENITIKSSLGGNLRIRSEVPLYDKKGKEFTKANGENQNEFYQKPEIKTPLISNEAKLKGLELPTYYLYDIPTKKGETIQLFSKK